MYRIKKVAIWTLNSITIRQYIYVFDNVLLKGLPYVIKLYLVELTKNRIDIKQYVFEKDISPRYFFKKRWQPI